MGISVITYLEFPVFPEITDMNRKIFEDFVSRIDVISIDINQVKLIDNIVRIRKEKNYKLPDAIIAATAIMENAALISNDFRLKNLDTLHIINF